jgi:hypothetical protein
MALLGSSAVRAQDVEGSQQKLLARRAAEADAYRKLSETIKGLRLSSETIVRDFVVESDTINSELDAFIKGVRLSEPHWMPDGTCEVTAEVTVQRVIEQLQQMHTQHYRGQAIRGTDFDNVRQSVKRDVIAVIGMGAPSPDAPPPTGGSRSGAGTQAGPSGIPPLWSRLPAQARLMAERAAEVDAQRRLLERIVGLRVNSSTQVRDFAVDFDSIRTTSQGVLVGAQKTRVYYHADEPIVEVTYAVPTEQVITTIKELSTRRIAGDDITETDIRNVREDIRGNTFEATGMGVPPPRFGPMVQEAVGPGMPDWAMENLTAVGQGTDPAMDTPQGKLKAVRAAETDAKRRLAERLGGFKLTATTSVNDFVLAHDEIRAQLDSLLDGVAIAHTEWKPNMVEVTVNMPGMQLWDVVSAPTGVAPSANQMGAPPVQEDDSDGQ